MYEASILLLAPSLVGVLVGYITGGRLRGLATLQLRALWLLWVATAVQAVQYYSLAVRRFIEDRIGLPMLAVVFALVALWLVVNLRQSQRIIRVAGVLILLGAFLNSTAILINGRMPYSTRAAVVAGLPTNVVTPKNVPGNDHTRLAFIGDVVPVPPLQKVVSPGDLLISLGAMGAVAAAMRRRPLQSQRTVGEEVNHDANPYLEAHAACDLHDRHDRDAVVHDRRTQ